MGKMSRYERNHTQTKPFFKTKIVSLIVLFLGLIVTTNIYLRSLIRIEAPEVDLGRKVVIQLQNGKEVQTYENLLFKQDGKLYYKGEFNTIDITGGTLVIQEWN